MNLQNLKPGDILICTGHRFLSRIIMKVTRSRFSHAALYIEQWGIPSVMDAQNDGINSRPFLAWDNKYQYDIRVFRHPEGVIEKAICMRAATKTGVTAYDFVSFILRYPIKLITGKWRQKKNFDSAMTCSEFVAWVYGVEKPYTFTPEDLYNWCLMNKFVEIEI